MSTSKNIAQFISRLILGAILIAHGWDKFQLTGLEGITGFFDSIGVPAAAIAAPVVATIEILGGIMLILGAFTHITGIILTLVMLGAAIFAHIPNGIFVGDGGWELVGAIGAGTLAFAAVGAGRYSIDTLIAQRSEKTPAQHEPRLQNA